MSYPGGISGNMVRCITIGVLLSLSVVWLGCGDEEETGEIVDLKTIEERSAPSRVIPAPAPPAAESFESRPDYVEETVAAPPESPEEVAYEEAERAYTKKRYDEAVDLFTAYTGQNDHNPWGFYMLGLSAWKSGDYEKAEEAFERALELDPRHVKSRLNWSRVLLETERPEEALEKIEAALEIDPGSNVAYRLEGRAFHQMGFLEEAIGAYRQAILIDDRDAWSMNNLGLIYIEEELFSDALPPLARAVELRDDIAVFQNNLGMALERTGHFRAAREAYAAASGLDSSYEKAFLNEKRIEAVAEDPSVGPVDLVALALGFCDEIDGWSERVASKDALETAETSGGVALVSEADSIGRGPEE